MLKAWDVTVVGYGTERINAASRGAALAKAWRSDAFSGITFIGFLKIASARRAMFVTEGFGAPITVDGKPAFFVDRNRAYVQIAYPGGKHVFSAHPYDVLPESFRPEAYRTPPVDRSPEGRDPRGSVHESRGAGTAGAKPLYFRHPTMTQSTTGLVETMRYQAEIVAANNGVGNMVSALPARRYTEAATLLSTQETTIAELVAALEGVQHWLASLADCDMGEIVADGGITAGMVVQQEAREQYRRLTKSRSAP